MGVREMGRFLEQWQMDARDLHRRMILAPTPRERERPLAVDARVDRLGYSRGIGAGSPHHRPVGHCLRRGRAGGFDVRAVRRFPPSPRRRGRS